MPPLPITPSIAYGPTSVGSCWARKSWDEGVFLAGPGPAPGTGVPCGDGVGKGDRCGGQLPGWGVPPPIHTGACPGPGMTHPPGCEELTWGAPCCGHVPGWGVPPPIHTGA